MRAGGGVEGGGLEGSVEEAPTLLKPNFRAKSCKQREQGMKKRGGQLGSGLGVLTRLLSALKETLYSYLLRVAFQNQL